ncbi:MAG: hypothetical protein OEW15_02755 [Nitrospirota bacterium]|nr:hypothetical protein [Nitrospirota bacterium]
MNALVLEFTDDVTQETAHFYEDRNDWLLVPRGDYLGMVEAARTVHAEWTLREGAEFLCETCRSFNIPAKALHYLLTHIADAKPEIVVDGDLLHEINRRLVRPYPMGDEDCVAYNEGDR